MGLMTREALPLLLPFLGLRHPQSRLPGRALGLSALGEGTAEDVGDTRPTSLRRPPCRLDCWFCTEVECEVGGLQPDRPSQTRGRTHVPALRPGAACLTSLHPDFQIC